MATVEELGKKYADQLKNLPTYNKAQEIVQEINSSTFDSGELIDVGTKLKIVSNIENCITGFEDGQYYFLKESDNKEYIKFVNYMYELINRGK
ncbi:hypothetical protein HNY42_13720 [Exiguobacterium sp. Helios]|uniref:hypothetical protein n=1 Tax=Exiguobacterium sp. Helios TaxID=2735868 RepID=UPI00165E19B1|nr:hypothetical protein [Exiguobacterium sp. Helios]QNR21954.1 hypothetical protein HNY42_13720 [Exiguobacterium sp. Helios]